MEHAGSGNGAVGKFGAGSRKRERAVFTDGEVAAVAFIRERSRLRFSSDVQGGKVSGVGGVEPDGAQVRRAGEDKAAVLHVQRAAGVQGSGEFQGAFSRFGNVGRAAVDGSGVLRIGTGRIRICSQQLVVQDDGCRLVVRAGDVDDAGGRAGEVVNRQAVSRIVHAREVECEVAVHDDRAVRVEFGVAGDGFVFTAYRVDLRGVTGDADGAAVDARDGKAEGFQQRVEDGRAVAQRSVREVEPRGAVARSPALHGIDEVGGEGEGEGFNFQLGAVRVKLDHGGASGQVLCFGDVARSHHQAGTVQAGGAVEAADDRSGVRHADGFKRGAGEAAQRDGSDAGGRVDGNVFGSFVVVSSREGASGDVERSLVAVRREGERAGGERDRTRVACAGVAERECARAGFQEAASAAERAVEGDAAARSVHGGGFAGGGVEEDAEGGAPVRRGVERAFSQGESAGGAGDVTAQREGSVAGQRDAGVGVVFQVDAAQDGRAAVDVEVAGQGSLAVGPAQLDAGAGEGDARVDVDRGGLRVASHGAAADLKRGDIKVFLQVQRHAVRDVNEVGIQRAVHRDGAVGRGRSVAGEDDAASGIGERAVERVMAVGRLDEQGAPVRLGERAADVFEYAGEGDFIASGELEGGAAGHRHGSGENLGIGDVPQRHGSIPGDVPVEGQEAVLPGRVHRQRGAGSGGSQLDRVPGVFLHHGLRQRHVPGGLQGAAAEDDGTRSQRSVSVDVHNAPFQGRGASVGVRVADLQGAVPPLGQDGRGARDVPVSLEGVGVVRAAVADDDGGGSHVSRNRHGFVGCRVVKEQGLPVRGRRRGAASAVGPVAHVARAPCSGVRRSVPGEHVRGGLNLELKRFAVRGKSQRVGQFRMGVIDEISDVEGAERERSASHRQQGIVSRVGERVVVVEGDVVRSGERQSAGERHQGVSSRRQSRHVKGEGGARSHGHVSGDVEARVAAQRQAADGAAVAGDGARGERIRRAGFHVDRVIHRIIADVQRRSGGDGDRAGPERRSASRRQRSGFRIGRAGIGIGAAERHLARTLLGDGTRSADGVGHRLVRIHRIGQEGVSIAAERHRSGTQGAGSRQQDGPFLDQGLVGIIAGLGQLKHAVPLLYEVGAVAFLGYDYIQLQICRISIVQRKIPARYVKDDRAAAEGQGIRLTGGGGSLRHREDAHSGSGLLRHNGIGAAEQVEAV
ncbi:unknown [Akkermansia sp. CAG:344]|nr:unknown [Akkermansia sp. CAG:344]